MNTLLCFFCFISLLFFYENVSVCDDSVAAPSNFWPSILVSATPDDDVETAVERKKTRTKHRTIQPNKRKNREQEQETKENEKHEEQEKEESSQVKWNSEYTESKQRVIDKLKCKYRKSCYEGLEPPPEAAKPKNTEEELKENSKEDDQIEEDNKEKQKLTCKYRYSCYAEKWPNLVSEKGGKQKQKAASILTSKPSSSVPSSTTHKKPVNLKKIAQQTLKELEEKELQNNQHPRPKYSHAKQRLMDAKEALEHKNKCKYRKSCYESGELPEIEESALMSWITSFSSHKPTNGSEAEEHEDDEEPRKQVRSFEEMPSLEKKLFCKYRYSCYPNGVPPKIAEETKFKGIKEIIKPVNRETPLVLRCKYRKSCYETGVLPDLNPQKNTDQKNNKPKPVPTTVEELKLQCKYRKSCYITKAQQVSREEDVPSPPLHTNVTESVASRLVSHNPSPPPHNHSPKKHSKKRTSQPKLYSKPVKQEVPAKENTKEFCKHQEDIKTEAEMAAKLQQKKDKKASKMAEKMIQPAVVVVEVEDELEEQETVEEVPDTIEEVATVEEEASEFSEEEPEKEDTSTPLLLSKAECKYRKSCYQTGKLVFNDQTTDVKPPKSIPRTELEMNRASLKSKLDCKYRKSCYGDQQIGQEEEEGRKEEEKVEDEKDSPDEDEEKIDEIAHPLYLSQEDKLACKYRESCYSTVGVPIHKKNATVTQAPSSQQPIRVVVYDGNGPACNTYSSKYYLSCQPKLGIAPKEKAPIGPNGKRLCRRKKRNESDQ